MRVSALFLIGLMGSQSVAAARELVDATGARVSVPESPQRVVTLAPALGELVAEVLQTDLERIVGVADRTDYPPALIDKASVGSFVAFNVEKVISLKPDLIFGTTDGNPKDRVAQLREQGLPVVVIRTSSIAEIEESFILVGKALNREKAAGTLGAAFRKGVDRLKGAAEADRGRRGGSRPRVLFQIGTEPLVVAGRKSFLNEALESLGAENVYGDLKTAYPKPTLEDAIQRRPDWIIVVGMESDLSVARRMAEEWKKLPFRGKQPPKVAALPGDDLLRPSMRLLRGLESLRRTLYGNIR